MKKLMETVLLCMLLIMTVSGVAAQTTDIAVPDTQIITAEKGDDVTFSDDPSDFVLLSDAVPDAIPDNRSYSEYNFAGDRIDGYEEPLAFQTKVSFLGPEGTYTEEAAKYWFQNGEQFIPRETVTDAIADVLADTSDFAVIPQENTLGGTVVNYVDALIAAEDAYVVGEVVLPISQTLMGVPGAALEDIKTVCSHVQGLTQSAQWRAENLPDAVTQEMSSTAAAAGYVAEQQDKSIAAVAAPGAALLYGLEVLAENVQITDANKTRFYVLSDMAAEDESLSRAVFVATCGGSGISEIIEAVSDAGLELVFLHDRPEGSALGFYHYVIEVEDSTGISNGQIDAVCAFDGVRFAGRFDTAEKVIN